MDNTLPRHLRLSLVTLTCLLALLHLWHGLNRVADPDEFQYLVNAFNAADGLRPYVHFWDNHGPLNIWLLQPFFEFWTGSHKLIKWLRLLPWINTLAVCAVLFSFMRRCYTDYPAAPWLTIIFLLATPPYVSKSIEIRGDNLTNLLTTVSFVSVFWGIRNHLAWPIFLAGLCVGITAGLTVKFLTVGTAIALAAAAACTKLRSPPRPRQIAAGLIGFAIPVAILTLLLYGLHLLSPFMICYFEANATRKSATVDSSELTELTGKAMMWTALAIGTWFFSLTRIVLKAADEIEIALFVILSFTVAQFIFLMPTKNMQSLLTCFPPLACLAGLYGDRLYRSVQTASWWSFQKAGLLAMVVFAGLAFGLWRYCGLKNRKLDKQIEFADDVLKRTAAERYIFDPSGIVFLKPKPEPFPVLVTFLRDMHHSHQIDLHVIETFEAFKIKSIVYDKRVEDLRDSDIAFIREHFLPVLEGPGSLLVQRAAIAMTTDTLRSDSEIYQWWTQGRRKKNKPATSENNADWVAKYLGYFEKNKRMFY